MQWSSSWWKGVHRPEKLDHFINSVLLTVEQTYFEIFEKYDQRKYNKYCTVKSRYLEVDGTIFYKFKLPEVQINLHFG